MHQHADGHRERLRKRLRDDPVALPDYEVLELLLGYALPRKDTKPLARELLARFRTLRGVMDARPQELLQTPGFGPALTAFMVLLRELLARYEAAPLVQREALVSPKAVADMARVRLAACPHEEMWAAFTDAGNRLLGWERLARGSVDMVSIQPRDIMERALARNASGIVLVHNHPGGSACPSREDARITESVQAAAQTLGIRLIDHLIVTDALHHSVLGGEAGGSV